MVFVSSFGLLTGNPLSGAILDPPKYLWIWPVVFSGVRQTYCSSKQVMNSLLRSPCWPVLASSLLRASSNDDDEGITATFFHLSHVRYMIITAVA
jgi:hypothetical protein